MDAETPKRWLAAALQSDLPSRLGILLILWKPVEKISLACFQIPAFAGALLALSSAVGLCAVLHCIWSSYRWIRVTVLPRTLTEQQQILCVKRSEWAGLCAA